LIYLTNMRSVAFPLVLVMASAAFSHAQGTPRTADANQTPQATFKAGVDLVTVSVSVRSRNGRVVRDLTKADFSVIDSDQAAEIRDFYVYDR
jgi:hypothetical protein